MTINLKNNLINGPSFGYFGYIGFDLGFWVSISKLCLLNFMYNRPSQFNVLGCPTSSQFHFAMHFKFLLFGFCKKKKKIEELRTWCVYNVSSDGEQFWILDQEHLKNTRTMRNLYQAHNQRFITITFQRPCLWVKTTLTQYLNWKLEVLYLQL